MSQSFFRGLRVCSLGLVLSFCVSAFGEGGFHAGFLFDEFPLALDAGHRTEAAGPFYYDQQKDTETTWAVPPLFSHDANPAVESEENDWMYPLLTDERYGTEYPLAVVPVVEFLRRPAAG